MARSKNAAPIDALMSMQFPDHVSGALPGLISRLGTGVVFIYGGYRVVHGEITIGTVVRSSPIRYASCTAGRRSWGCGQTSRLRRCRSLVSEILDAPWMSVKRTTPSCARTVAGYVELADVTLSFDRGRPALDRRCVVHGAPRRKCSRLLVRAAAAKSTIADLLLRLLDPDEGTVRLVGIDLRHIQPGCSGATSRWWSRTPCILRVDCREHPRRRARRMQKSGWQRVRRRSSRSSSRCRRHRHRGGRARLGAVGW